MLPSRKTSSLYSHFLPCFPDSQSVRKRQYNSEVIPYTFSDSHELHLVGFSSNRALKARLKYKRGRLGAEVLPVRTRDPARASILHVGCLLGASGLCFHTAVIYEVPTIAQNWEIGAEISWKVR